MFSVALSRGLRRVGVTNHRALPSSDFPPGAAHRHRDDGRAERSPPPASLPTIIICPFCQSCTPVGGAGNGRYRGARDNDFASRNIGGIAGRGPGAHMAVGKSGWCAVEPAKDTTFPGG